MKRSKEAQHSSEEYQMKKSLRRTPAPKSYLQPEDQMDINQDLRQRQRQTPKQSIFEHKNWTFKEKIRLMVFLSFYENLSDWGSERRSIYLYKNLSLFIKSQRTPEQCKNIHSLLKRKFTSIPQIVLHMQLELEKEDNYTRLLVKYQKEIMAFQKEHNIKDNVYQDEYMPISSRRGTEREEDRTVKVEKKQKQKIQPREGELALGRRVVMPVEFEERRSQLIAQCNNHFKEWLMCTQVLEKRREPQQQ